MKKQLRDISDALTRAFRGGRRNNFCWGLTGVTFGLIVVAGQFISDLRWYLAVLVVATALLFLIYRLLGFRYSGAWSPGWGWNFLGIAVAAPILGVQAGFSLGAWIQVVLLVLGAFALAIWSAMRQEKNAREHT